MNCHRGKVKHKYSGHKVGMTTQNWKIAANETISSFQDHLNTLVGRLGLYATNNKMQTNQKLTDLLMHVEFL
jgi:hypothetical protein